MEHVLNETLTGSSTRHNYRKFQFKKQIDFFIFLRCHGTGLRLKPIFCFRISLTRLDYSYERDNLALGMKLFESVHE